RCSGGAGRKRRVSPHMLLRINPPVPFLGHPEEPPCGFGSGGANRRDPPKSLERVRPLSRFWGSRTKRHFDLGGRAQSARDPPKSLERVRPLSRFWGSRTKRHVDLGGRAQSARDPPKSLERVRLPQNPYFYPMQTLQLECNTLDELPRCARELLKFAGDQRIMLFYGEMGAGKTTLIRSICQELRVTGPVSSPTFALVNE